jgi:hypothetical protein
LEFFIPFLGNENRIEYIKSAALQNQNMNFSPTKDSKHYMVDTGQGSIKCTLCGKCFMNNHMQDYLVSRHQVTCPNRY